MKNRLPTFFFTALLLTLPAARAQLDRQKVAENLVRVVYLLDAPDFKNANQLYSTTGVVVNDQSHIVISNIAGFKPQAFLVMDGPVDPAKAGKPAQVVWSDENLNLAVLKTEPLHKPGLELSAKAAVKGSTVYSAGFNDQPPKPLAAEPEVANGRIVDVYPIKSGDQMLVHDAGFSGGRTVGAIVDDCTQWVAVNIVPPSTTSAGSSELYALPAEALARIFKKVGIAYRQAASVCPAAAATAAAGAAASTAKTTPAPAPKRAAPKPSADRDQVRQAQIYLNALGYPVGRPDGVYGQKTKTALMAFQMSEKQPKPDGRLTPELLGLLKKRLENQSTQASVSASGQAKTGGAKTSGQAVQKPQVSSTATSNQSPATQNKAANKGAGSNPAKKVPSVSSGTLAASGQNSDRDRLKAWALPVLLILVLLVIGFIVWLLIRKRKRAQKVTVERATEVLRKAQRDSARAASDLGQHWSLTFTNPAYGAPVTMRIQVEELRQGSGLLIGREDDLCDLIVNHDSVSRQHARIYLDGRQLMLADLESTNGTRIDSRPVAADRPAILSENAEIALGEAVLTLTRENSSEHTGDIDYE